MKRRHLLLMALSLIISICMCFAFAGCDSCNDDKAPAKLSTPVVTVDDKGVASWLEVENASGYAYVIGNGEETATNNLSVNLADGQSIKVKAKGDGKNYTDSDFSEVKTYTAPSKQPVQLAGPSVSIGTDGTVTIGTVEHAVKIVYVIGDGAETEYDANNKPVLTDGQTIKVTAKGDGVNYSDSEPVTKTYDAEAPAPAEVMTRAEFIAAADSSSVAVAGKVSAMTAVTKNDVTSYNVYLQDNDGGYYAYGVAAIPEGLAVGMEIKVSGTKTVYNGLNEITNATIEITDNTVSAVTPIDVTGKIGNNDELLALQSSLVTVNSAVITSVTVDAEKNRTNVVLTVGDKTVTFYIGGSQVVDATQQNAITESFKANEGKTVDVTALVSLFSNTAQLIPANAEPITNIHTDVAVQLPVPVVEIDDNGVVTVTVDENAVKAVYTIGDATEPVDYDANNKPVLTKGQTITVTAIGDGTAYSDSDAVVKKYIGVMTHAEYAAAAKDAEVCVKGIVTAFSGKNVYLQDSDGGYYAFKSTAVPDNLTVGMEVKVTGVKDVYKSFETAKFALDEIVNATIVITNATPATVAPVDVTSKVGNEDELKVLQNTLTIVKGVTITTVTTTQSGGKDRTNVTLTIDGKTITFYIGGTQMITEQQQKDVAANFKKYEGKVADVTGIISLSGNNLNLIPANATPISNVVLEKLNAPAIEIDEDTGVATVIAAETKGGDKLFVSVDGAEFTEYDANNKPVVPYGKTIRAYASDTTENYADSEEASATYNVAQVKITETPEFTIGATSGTVRITKTVEHATGYRYTVLDADGNAIADKTDILYDPEHQPVLEDGQSIKFKSVGGGKYLDSDYGEAIKFVKTNTLRTPELTVDKNGNVSWQATDGGSFTYKIKDKDATDYNTPVENVDKNNRTVKLTDGQTIQVMAVRDEAVEGQQNSLWSEELTYKAPVQRTAPEITSFERNETTADGKVLLKWTTADNVEYALSLNGAEAVTVENGEVEITIADYTSIELIALGTDGEPQAEGDYSNLFADSVATDAEKEANLTKYTAFYDGYKANIELNALTAVSLIVDDEEIVLTSNGTTYKDVAFTWAIVGGDTSYATLSDNTLTVIASDVTAGETITLKATVTGKDTLYKEFAVLIKAGEKATMSYAGTTSTNLSDTANSADLVGLDETMFNVSSEKHSGTVHVALNKAGYIRIHKNNADTMVVSIAEGDSYKIGKFSISLHSQSEAALTDLLVKVNDKEVSTTQDGVYLVNAKSFSLTCKNFSFPIDIASINIVYLAPELTDAQKADIDLNRLDDISGEYGATNSLNLAKVIGEKSGFEIAYTATKTSTEDTANGTLVINEDGTVTITQGDAATVFTVTATIACTCGEASHTHTRDFTVTVKVKPAEGQTDPVVFDFTNGFSASTNAYTTSTGTSALKTACNSNEFFTGVTATTKAYPDGACIKLGSSKATGSITLSFSKKVAKITINLAKYGSDTGLLKVTNCDNVTPPATAGDIELILSSSTDSITLATTAKRCKIYRITVEFE